MDETVDILEPPLFNASGKTKPREQAFADGDWIGTFNLWVFSRMPEPSILYQQRSLSKSWAPGLLDVAGGHYQAGEKLVDGLREIREELGKDYPPEDILYLGRKVYVGLDSGKRARNNIVEVYMAQDDSPLSDYKQQVEEVSGLCHCPVRELLIAHKDPGYRFKVTLLTNNGEETELLVGKSSFPENWDDYHYKLAILANRYFNGDQDLLY